MNRWYYLANAIVVQAAYDWRAAQKRLQANPYELHSLRVVKEIEKFFRSDWYKVLSKIKGDELLSRLQLEAESGVFYKPEHTDRWANDPYRR